MGDAILCYRVLPDSVESVDLVEAKLNEMKPKGIQKKPIAFGLSAFDVTFVIPDKEGVDTDKIEKELEELEGVGSVEVVGATLA
jgi:translation elongation factor aEF-1 beta